MWHFWCNMPISKSIQIQKVTFHTYIVPFVMHGYIYLPCESLVIKVDSQWINACHENVHSKVKLESVDQQRVHDVSLDTQRHLRLWHLSDVVDDLDTLPTRHIRGFDNPKIIRISLHLLLQEVLLGGEDESVFHEAPPKRSVLLSHPSKVLKTISHTWA